MYDRSLFASGVRCHAPSCHLPIRDCARRTSAPISSHSPPVRPRRLPRAAQPRFESGQGCAFERPEEQPGVAAHLPRTVARSVARYAAHDRQATRWLSIRRRSLWRDELVKIVGQADPDVGVSQLCDPTLPWVAACAARLEAGATPSSGLVTALLPDALPVSGPRMAGPRPFSDRPAATSDVTRRSIISPQSQCHGQCNRSRLRAADDARASCHAWPS